MDPWRAQESRPPESRRSHCLSLPSFQRLRPPTTETYGTSCVSTWASNSVQTFCCPDKDEPPSLFRAPAPRGPSPRRGQKQSTRINSLHKEVDQAESSISHGKRNPTTGAWRSARGGRHATTKCNIANSYVLEASRWASDAVARRKTRRNHLGRKVTSPHSRSMGLTLYRDVRARALVVALDVAFPAQWGGSSTCFRGKLLTYQ